MSIDEMSGKINDKLKVWRHALESKGFKFSKTKIKHLESKLSGIMHKGEMEVKIDVKSFPREGASSILGLLSKETGRLMMMSHIIWARGGRN